MLPDTVKRVKKYGIYRGIVVDNNDDGIIDTKDGAVPIGKAFGRCKIFFEGIYPEKYRKKPENLPWAEPVYPIFGGNTSTAVQKDTEKDDPSVIKNYTNSVVGWASVPHTGTYVWGFFEEGNIQYPKFFGTTQAGPMFMAEHKNQHIICTDNVKIIIDEEPENEKATTYNDSLNKECTSSVVANSNNLCLEKMPTTVNITITAVKPEKGKREETDYCAVNLNITGNINMNVKGNIYENHEGHRFITQVGNTFHKITGDIEIEHTGYLKETHYGNRDFTVTKGTKGRDLDVGDDFETYTENRTVNVGINQTTHIGGNHTETVVKDETTKVMQNSTRTVQKNDSLTVGANKTVKVSGSESNDISSTVAYKSGAGTSITAGGNVDVKGAVINLN